jgi:hypothetical protein
MREYRERLRVPLAWWLLAVPTVLILGGPLYAGLPWPWPILIIGGLAVGYAAMLIAFSQGSVEVGDGTLRAGGAVLPLTAVSEVVVLDERQSTQLRGPRADPAAHLYLRPYLKESVYVALEPAARSGDQDAQRAPGSPAVPYWLIGTRHPTELAAAIERCRAQAGHEPVGLLRGRDKKEAGGMAEKRRSGKLWLWEGLAEFSAADGIIAGLAATAASVAARQVITFVWTKATGKEPPIHPSDPQVGLPEALSWSILAGVTLGTARLLAIRAATRGKRGGPDRELAKTAHG